MLDMLKLKLSTRFMRGWVAKFVSKKVSDAVGCKVDIRFRDIEIDMNNGDLNFHIDMDGKINKSDLESLLQGMD